MRKSLLAIFALVLSSPLMGVGLTTAGAMPVPSGIAIPSPLERVRLVCDPNRCIDPRTGAYTYSGCSYRGCYPISGVVGYTNPNGGEGYGYGNRYGYGYGYPGRGRWGY
jgi:hypothetical protein